MTGIENLQVGDLIVVSYSHFALPAIVVGKGRSSPYFLYIYRNWRHGTHHLANKKSWIAGNFVEQRIWRITPDQLNPEQFKLYEKLRRKLGLNSEAE